MRSFRGCAPSSSTPMLGRSPDFSVIATLVEESMPLAAHSQVSALAWTAKLTAGRNPGVVSLTGLVEEADIGSKVPFCLYRSWFSVDRTIAASLIGTVPPRHARQVAWMTPSLAPDSIGGESNPATL